MSQLFICLSLWVGTWNRHPQTTKSFLIAKLSKMSQFFMRLSLWVGTCNGHPKTTKSKGSKPKLSLCNSDTSVLKVTIESAVPCQYFFIAKVSKMSQSFIWSTLWALILRVTLELFVLRCYTNCDQIDSLGQIKFEKILIWCFTKIQHSFPNYLHFNAFFLLVLPNHSCHQLSLFNVLYDYTCLECHSAIVCFEV